MDACNILNFKFYGFYIKGTNNAALKQEIRLIIKKIIRL